MGIRKFLQNLLPGSVDDPNQPRLVYAENGRDGYVVYKDQLGELPFYFEFGGGNCVAIISIPKKEDWAKTTKRPDDSREQIINFIAIKVIKEKTPGCRAVFTNSSIDFMKL